MKEHTDILNLRLGEHNFIYADECYICNGSCTKTKYKVKNHCHRTGSYRGAAHATCNVTYYNNNTYLPVVLHNLRGYDSPISLISF